MTAAFDKTNHRIVAVNVDPDSPDRGNHFHLSLPDLALAASELPAIDWSPIEQRLTAIETARNLSSTLAIDLAPMDARMTAIEAAVKEIAAARETTPLVPVVMPDQDARIAALEEHAVAHGGLVDALQTVLKLARDQDARTARLEAEAKETHRAVATALPALNAVIAMARR
jgi:hypothetical protein